MPYRFKAIYNDGTCLEENPKDPKACYKYIDRTKLEYFELFDINTRQVALKIRLDKGQRLIWRRRKVITPGQGEETVHIVGKQQTVGGKNIQGIALLYPDGSCEFFEKFNKEHPWLRPVELLSEEL